MAFLSDGLNVSTPILASVLPPATAKGVIYKVQKDFSREEIKFCLNSLKISFVKIFKLKVTRGILLL